MLQRNIFPHNEGGVIVYKNRLTAIGGDSRTTEVLTNRWNDAIILELPEYLRDFSTLTIKHTIYVFGKYK